MAAFVRTQYGMKATGTSVTVPNNSKAKLMYYLKTVSNLLELDNPHIGRLTDYRNYAYLGEGETDLLLKLVVILSPDELIGKVMFLSDDLCGDSNNEFYEISQVRNIFALTDTILVGGERTKVVQIMTYKHRWMMNNYIRPIDSYQRRLVRIAAGLPGYEVPARNTSSSCNIL